MQGKCPICDELYEVEDRFAGMQADCPSCGKTIVIAAAPKERPAAPAPSQPQPHRSPGGGLIGYSPPNSRQRRGGILGRLVKGVAIVAVLALVAWGAWIATFIFFGKSSVSTYAGLMPTDPDLVGYIDLAALAKQIDASKAAKANEVTVDDLLGELARKSPLKRLEADELRDVCFGARYQSDEVVLVVRLKSKRTLRELLDEEGVVFAEHEGIPMASIRVGAAGDWLLIAELKPGVFAVTAAEKGPRGSSSEPVTWPLETIIDRHVEDAEGEFGDDLRRAMAKVNLQQIFFAGKPPNRPTGEKLDWLAASASLGTWINLRFVAKYANESDAREGETKIRNGLEGVVKRLQAIDDKDWKEVARLVVRLVEDIEVKRDGALLELNASWWREALDAVVEAIPEDERDGWKEGAKRGDLWQ